MAGGKVLPWGQVMNIDAVRDNLRVRVGATFQARDARRVEEVLAALGPFHRLTIDFEAVRQCDDAALTHLATSLMSLSTGEITLRGLSEHQWRLLTYVGVRRSSALWG